MTTSIFVQFSDEFSTAIVSIFGCAQDPLIWPNQGVLLTNDPRYAAFYEMLIEDMRILLPNPSID